MSNSNTTPAGRFTLPLDSKITPLPTPELPGLFQESHVSRFPPALIIRNALWFCRLRWGIVAILMFLGAIGLLAEKTYMLGLKPNATWSFGIAAFLVLANLLYLWHLKRLGKDSPLEPAQLNLWTQIAVDLFTVSCVIHFMGSLETYSPFLYLLHIVLACIFFPRRYSLVVTLTAFGLYLTVLGMEASGVLSVEDGIYASRGFRQSFGEIQIAVNVTTILVIWLTVWYLASRVAAIIHQRDRELADSNDQLLRTQLEKTKHMLRTTHELKAPFAAIHANTQLLLNGYCGNLPPEALSIVRKIAERSRRLSGEIQAMLQLANLTTINKNTLRWVKLDVEDVLKKCIDQIRPLATEKGITLQAHLESAIITSVEDHITMIITNLISNAVNYSYKGGTVHVYSKMKSENDQKIAWICIEDAGIGILPEKLPRIFEEYYRTEEGAAHNKESSGLGLAIVKTIAITHMIQVQVESTPEKGTRFTLEIPVNPQKTISQEAPRGLKRIHQFIDFARGGI